LSEVSKWDRRLILAVILIALVVRIAYVIDIKDSPYFSHPVLDSFWYDAKAKDILGGDVLASSGSFRMPLYVYFIALCYLIFGPGSGAPTVIQAFIGAGTCGLVYVIAKRLFGRLAALVAGLGLALYRMAIYSDGEMLPTTLFMLFMLAATHYAIVGIERRRVGHGVLVGLFLGLAFLTRPDILPFAVLLLGGMILIARISSLRVAVPAGVVLAIVMLLLGYRNQLVFGEFYVLSPQGAVNLYIGNAGFADGKTPVAPATRYPYHIASDPSEDSIILACKQAALESVGRELSDKELSGYYVRKTIAEIRGDIPAWLALMAKKAYYFLNSYERSDIKLIPRFIREQTRVLKLPLVTYTIAMPLGVVGLGLVVVRRRKRAWLVVAGVIAFTVNTLLFFIVWRYRLPAVPGMLILGGYAVSQTYEAARGRCFRLLAAIVIIVAVLAGLSLSRFWEVGHEQWASQYKVNEAALFLKAGNLDKAVELYREAIEDEPSNPRTYFYLGKAYATQGMVSESKKAMEQAMMLNPGYRPFANMTLGVAFANAGDFETAASHFAEALDDDGELGLAAYNLGLCLMSLGDYGQAESTFTRAQFLCKDDKGVLVAISRAFTKMGRSDKGVALAQGIVRQDPRNAEALYALGLGLEAEGRIAEAIAEYERALRYMPSSKDLREKIRDLKARQSAG
jgi:tetratricopeptide (TPR) repeat protein